MPIITKNTITYNETDFLAGLHPQSGTKTIPQKFGKFSRDQFAFNPFNDLGYAKNGFLNTNFNNSNLVTTRLIAKTGDDADSDFYALDDKDTFHAIINYTTISSGTDYPHSITGAVLGDSKRCLDVVKYGSYYYYAWRGTSASAADIGRFNPFALAPTPKFVDDYMSTTPVGADYAWTGTLGTSLCVGYDDILYSGGQSFISSYDAYTGGDGTFTEQRLKLPSNYDIVKLLKLQPKSMVIFAQGDGDCKVFFWDYLSDDPYLIKDLYDFEILAAFEYKGTVACITSGRENYNKIKVFNGSEFETIATFSKKPDGTHSLLGPVNHGVSVNDNEIYWFCTDGRKGYIYCYGNNVGLKNTVNIIGKIDAYISDSVTYYPGILSVGRSNEMMASCGQLYYDTTPSAVCQYLDYTKYATEGLWYSDLADIGYERIQITGITVYFADEFTGGRTISVSLYDRYTTYPIKRLTNLGTVTSTNRIFRTKPFNNTDDTLIPPLDGIGIKLDWGAGSGSSVTPIINKVVLDYKPVTIN
jgi:hypothetical protein